VMTLIRSNLASAFCLRKVRSVQQQARQGERALRVRVQK
jgi:hypothetical protein